MSWICSRCETVNDDTFDICEVCDTVKPYSEPPRPITVIASESKPEPEPEHKSSNSWMIGLVIVMVCLCLGVAGVTLVGASVQNTHATETAVSQNATATAWAEPFYSQTFDSAPEWEWLDNEGIGFVVEYGKIKGNVAGQMAAWTLAGQSFSDIKIDIDIEKISGTDNNQIGVFCNATDTRHFYAFVIGTDQTYIIWKQNGDDDETLVDWANSSAINEGTAINHVTVICNGGNLTLLANGIELVTVYDTSYSQGDVGIILGSFEENAPVSAYFDNFNVSNP